MNDLSELIFDQVSFGHFPENLVLKNISFKVKMGQMLGVIGPNGGGKSTLLKLIVGPYLPVSGKITWEGKEFSNSFRPTQIIGYVPQIQVFKPLMPIRVIDLLLLEERKLNQKQFMEKHATLIERLGLRRFMDQMMSSLSGGEKQRVLICRALMKNPKILILDEPFNGLDGTGHDQLHALLRSFHSQMIQIVVDHHLGQVIKHADQIICLNREGHWHDKKEMLTKKILENFYHCEFEHLLLHQDGKSEEAHFSCEHDKDEHKHHD